MRNLRMRDKNITAKNEWIRDLTARLNSLCPDALNETGIASLQSLNAIIGSKHDKFFNLRDDVFLSPDDFVARWLSELDRLSNDGHISSITISNHMKRSKKFTEYLRTFLKRSFLIHFHEWSRVRPKIQDAEIWIGQRNANYGLLVKPRFANGQWENDKSEIRAAPFNYWTIGHVLKTGLVMPSKDNEVFKFKTVEDYFLFFESVIVRASGSQYEIEVADCYKKFVLAEKNQNDIPLLIPELRYDGLAIKHKYRLDFTIINPYTQQKVGFELSPWSTHGYLAKTKEMTQAEINEAAKNNFEQEMRKHRDYFKKFNITVLIYTDTNLKDCRKLFEEDIKPRLSLEKPRPAFPFDVARKYGI